MWAFFSFYQSLVLYYFPVNASLRGKNSSGKMFGLWDVSTMAFTCVVVTVNLRLLMASNSVTRWHYISVGGSILAWFIFIFIYSGVMTPYDRQVRHYFESLLKEFVVCNLVHCLTTIFDVPGKYLLCDLRVDGYILLLSHASVCSCCCTFWRFCISWVSSVLCLITLHFFFSF